MDYEFKEFSFEKAYKGRVVPEPELLIGCPIQKREWIIEKWWNHAFFSAKEAGVKPGFIFVMDLEEQPLSEMVMNLAELFTTRLYICDVKEEDREDKRVWSSLRYEKMVMLRNILLEGVRNKHPKWFLSLDSDILLHRDAIKSMMEKVGDYDAIGSKAYLSHRGTNTPNFGKLKNGKSTSYTRYESSHFMEVDILMAVKLMKESAYNVPYSVASQGEDIGWSMNCKERGLKFAWDGTVANKHVMRKQDLEVVDQRVNF